MASTLKHYDPAQVVIMFGVAKLEGTAPDGRVSIEFPEGYGHVVGTDGEVARFKINDPTCKVTVPLLQTSQSNDVLTALYLADRVAPTGAPLTLFIKDINGTSLFTAAGAWIVGLPATRFVGGVEAREWTFQTAAVIPFVGGNSNLTA